MLLPPEDLENDCLTALVGQIFSEMILGGGIGGKACEPWLLWEGITKIVEVVQVQLPNSRAQERVDRSSINKTEPELPAKRMMNFRISVQQTFWLVLQYAFLVGTAIRFLFLTIASASSLPSRLPASERYSMIDDSQAPTTASTAGQRQTQPQTQPVKQAIITMKIWACASNLLDLDVRMTWLRATLSMLQWAALWGPGKVGNTNGMLDK